MHTIERIESLYQSARERLEGLGIENVHCYLGDGSVGLPGAAPFDAILVSAASPAVPPPLIEQLKMGGRLVLPIGQVGEHQVYRRYRRRPGAEPPSCEDLLNVKFVPLRGAHGWGE